MRRFLDRHVGVGAALLSLIAATAQTPGAHANAETAGALRFRNGFDGGLCITNDVGDRNDMITGGHVKTGPLGPFQFHRFLAINQHMGGARRA